MSYINTIISAIGNNNSIYPLLVRDCGIEVPTKVYKTYKQNSDQKEIAYLATREKLIDEYSTSAVWLGGIPLIGTISDKIIKRKGFNPTVNVKLIQAEEELAKIDKQIEQYSGQEVPAALAEKRKKIALQSLSGNIERFSAIEGAQDAIESLKKVKLNQGSYKKLQAGKFFAQMALPIALMGFIIPKAVYAMTAATRKKIEALKTNYQAIPQIPFGGIDTFKKNADKSISFKGNFASTICNFSTVDKMAITDGGYAVGRVATARKKRGAIDIGFKMLGMLYLNFVAPKQIEKILSYASKQLFNIDVNLDPIILGDEEFITQINTKTLSLPKTNKIEDMLDFIDNPKNKKSLFVKYAKELKKIEMLDNGVRNPGAYVEEESLASLRDNMENFMNEISKIQEKVQARLKNKNLEGIKINEEISKFAKKFTGKAKAAKTFNILLNVGISSYLLACVLPDVQYFLREKILGTKLEPDLI